MSIVVNGEYLGLPVPDYDEKSILYEALYEETHTGLCVEETAMAIVEFRPAIQRVIDHDKEIYMNDEVDEEMPECELTQYIFGIDAGYEFAIGCMSYVYFLRSDYNSLEDYLANDRLTRVEVPLHRRYQSQRVQLVREGQACIDYTVYEDGEDANSSYIAALEVKHYDDHAGGILDLLDVETANNRVNNTDEPSEIIDAYNDGMVHGFENAICMYIQSWEAAIIANAEKGLARFSK